MSETITEKPFKCGYVALVGKPNVGKSTLMNAIVELKVSIVSSKPQTTRRKITGIANKPGAQIIFIDTPGVHAAHTRLDRAMVDSARSAMVGADLLVAVVDGGHHPGEMDREVATWIHRMEQPVPVLLCMNKMDLLKPEFVQPYVDAFSSLFKPVDYMLTQADRLRNVSRLTDLIISHLPEHPAIFAEDEYTDQSSRFMASELVREKILNLTRQEVPYATAVTVDSWEEEGALTKIEATIIVDKGSQRGILIGKGGSLLREIGETARKEIEELIGTKIFLNIHIKVETNWRMNPRILHELEYADD